MNKIVKGLVVTGLTVTGFMGMASFATPQASASSVHYVKWNKPMKHHSVAVNGRKASWKGYTLKKVSNKHYRFKTAAKLNSTRYQVHTLTTLRHAKIDHSIYYGVRIGKKGQMVWVNRKYLTGFVENLNSKATTSTKSSSKKATNTKKVSKKTTNKTTKKTSNISKTAGKMYVNTTKHITWTQWLNLPAFGAEGNGIPLYNVDNVPYDEDGFPYVSNKMGSASPIEVTQLKSDFTAAAYAAIPDKSNTYYMSDKNALYHPTNPEVGQAIRDKIPNDTSIANSKQTQAQAGNRVAEISSNFTLANMTVGETKTAQMWSSVYGNLKLSDAARNTFTMQVADPTVASAPSKTTTGKFTITAKHSGSTTIKVTSVNNPNLYETFTINVK
ncbi:hypothetical protein [Levilactobacillus sp. N40-8-2]|uniref:hypothetical protein n=1 Tax=Levilactobacillus muriae TaxID=3238987 RepID=UPI0038B269FD